MNELFSCTFIQICSNFPDISYMAPCTFAHLSYLIIHLHCLIKYGTNVAGIIIGGVNLLDSLR